MGKTRDNNLSINFRTSYIFLRDVCKNTTHLIPYSVEFSILKW